MENAEAMRTASWTSASLAPAAVAASTSAAVRPQRVAPDGPGDVEQRPHLGVEAVGRAVLDHVDRPAPGRRRALAFSSSAVANAPWESMQKKQSFAAETAVASISRSCRRSVAPG